MIANSVKKDRNTTILVIDDEEVVRLLFQSLLEEEGYATLQAVDGAQGVRMLEAHRPPLALVDKNLPDVSGLELISTQKKRHPDTEFIMITGYASLDSAVKAMEAGAFSYLTKPFVDINVVLDRIRAALEVTQLRTETSLLRERLASLHAGGPAKVSAASPSRKTAQAPARVQDQIRHTVSFLESFSNKRDQVPPAPIWARLVDMMEEERRRLLQLLDEENRF